MIEPEIWTIKMADHPQDDFVRLIAYKALDLQKAELMVENARLKAEVEVQNQRIDLRDEDVGRLYCENSRLKAEVERLRKAGDAMAEAMWYGDAERSIWVKKFAETDWLAAKEGKQP